MKKKIFLTLQKYRIDLDHLYMIKWLDHTVKSMVCTVYIFVEKPRSKERKLSTAR